MVSGVYRVLGRYPTRIREVYLIRNFPVEGGETQPASKQQSQDLNKGL